MSAAASAVAPAAAPAPAQMPVRTFTFRSLNNTQIQCMDNVGTTHDHNHEIVTESVLRDRFIADIAKDGPPWQFLHPILQSIYNPYAQPPQIPLIQQTHAYYNEQLIAFTNIDDTDSNITPYPNIPKSSNISPALKVLEPNVDIVFNESGYGPSTVCKSHNPTVIYTPASLLDSLGTKGNTFWPRQEDNINIVFNNDFMRRMGFYGTQWIKDNNNIIIAYTAAPTQASHVITQPVTADLSVYILQTGQFHITPYMQGNDYKNSKIIQNYPGNLNECIKLIETKELGDFMQVLLYLAYIMIKQSNINNVSMITTDSVVFATCIKLRLPCLYTGCRHNVLSGHATFYKYTPGLINYLDKLKSMINHTLTSIIKNNTIIMRFLEEISINSKKLKFIINHPTARGPKKIFGYSYHPYERGAVIKNSASIEQKNKHDIDRLIKIIGERIDMLKDTYRLFLDALNTRQNTYIRSEVYAIIEAGQQYAAAAATPAAAAAAPAPAAAVPAPAPAPAAAVPAPAAAAPAPAAAVPAPAAAAPAPTPAQLANDAITEIYTHFRTLTREYRVDNLITCIDDDNYILCPGTRLFDEITKRMNIKVDKKLDEIIKELEKDNPVAMSSRNVGARQSKVRKAAIAESIAASAAFQSSLYPAASSSSAASAAFQSSLYPAASSSSAASAAAAAPPTNLFPNNVKMQQKNGGAINFENDYKELIQSINKEIENKDSELITNLFLCYAFQLLITMQDVMEYGLSKSDKLFELAIESTNPKDISSLNELIVYNEFINSIHYYSIKDKKNSDASLYFGSYLLALDNEVYHYEFAIIYDKLISIIDSDTVLNKYQIGEICGTNDNNILKYGKILKKYINFIDDNSTMMKNIEKSVAQMIKNTIDMTKKPTTGSTILMTKKSITGSTKKSITGSTKSIYRKLKRSLSRDRRHKIPVGGTRKKIDTRKRQQKHKRHSRKSHSHKHAAIRTSKARPAPRRFR